MEQDAVAPCEGSQLAPAQRQPPLLDLLPDGVLHEVLSHVQWSARATSKPFRSHIDAGRDSLTLRWPASPAQLPALRAMLARLPQLQDLIVSCEDCPTDGLTALAVPTLTSLTVSESNYDQCTTIVDLSPLTSCTALVHLELGSCVDLVDISPLVLCPTLTTLALQDAGLTDASPLAAMKGLESLNLEGCHSIEDFTLLAHCTALSDLNVGRCDGLLNLTSLASCRLLEALDAADCDGVTCLAPLATCTLLTSLRVGSTSLTSITPLAALTSLRSLGITACHNDVAVGLRPLAGLTALVSLSIGEVRYSDLVPLTACGQLVDVWLSHCASALDLGPLVSLSSLSVLIISYWKRGDAALPDLRPLASCPLLSSLHLTSSMRDARYQEVPGLFLDLSALGACMALVQLRLGGHNITCIKPLAHCPALARLTLWECAPTLTDLCPLTGCMALTALDLDVRRGGDWLPDFSSAAGCLALQTLDIHTHPRVGDVSALAALGAFPSLTALALDGRRVLDLTCLTACTNLQSLQLYGGMRDIDTSFLAGLTGLKVERVRCKSGRPQSSSGLDWDVHDRVKGAIGGRERTESEEVDGEAVMHEDEEEGGEGEVVGPLEADDG